MPKHNIGVEPVMQVPRQRIKRLIGIMRGEWRRMARDRVPEATRTHDLRVVLSQLASHSIPLRADITLVGRASPAQSGLREEHGVTVFAVFRVGRTLANQGSDLVGQADELPFLIGPQDW